MMLESYWERCLSSLHWHRKGRNGCLAVHLWHRFQKHLFY